jgi:hypothetical protein
MKSVPSENMLALRKLTAELCLTEDDLKYKNIVIELKDLIREWGIIVKYEKTNKGKIKCYENMCVKITNLLKNIEI